MKKPFVAPFLKAQASLASLTLTTLSGTPNGIPSCGTDCTT